MELMNLSALALASKIKQGELTAVALIEQLLAVPDKCNCIIAKDKEYALRQAEQVQKKISAGEALSPLAGIPLAVKDNICVKGMPATCGSKMLKDFVPPYDATVITKIREAGMIPFAKLNMDEFAMGSTSETSVFGAVKNPHNGARTAGGSSGGAAAAVAGGNALLALGSDTGGSVRQPCAYCGTVGLKPTYGAVSRYGLIAYASSLDTIGTVTSNVLDTAALYGIIKGRDFYDATSLDSPSYLPEEIKEYDLRGRKIGIPAEFLDNGTDDEVRSAVLSAAEKMKALGAEVKKFRFPLTQFGVAAYYIIACAEASSNLARYDGIRYGYRAENCKNIDEVFVKSRSEGFGYEVKKRVMLGNFVLSKGYYEAYYQKALKVKTLIVNAFNEAFQKYDFLLAPVTPNTAPKLGESLSDPLQMYLSDIDTVMVNLAGLPALSLPCGRDKNNLPIGMQLIGRPFDEKTILGAGYAFENRVSI